jgi:hypothetical protein
MDIRVADRQVTVPLTEHVLHVERGAVRVLSVFAEPATVAGCTSPASMAATGAAIPTPDRAAHRQPDRRRCNGIYLNNMEGRAGR